MLEELRRWRARRPAPAQGLLFTTLKGTPIHSSALRAMVKRRSGKAGLTKDVHPHMLRHTFASHAVMSGASLYAVQKLLGHKTAAVTQKYAHLAPDFVGREVARMTFAPKVLAKVIEIGEARKQAWTNEGES